MPSSKDTVTKAYMSEGQNRVESLGAGRETFPQYEPGYGKLAEYGSRIKVEILTGKGGD